MTKAFHLLTLFVCPLVPLRGHDSHHTLNHHLITYLFLFVTWLIYVFEKYLQLYLELVWINLTNVWIVNFANNLWSMSSSQFNISLGYFCIFGLSSAAVWPELQSIEVPNPSWSSDTCRRGVGTWHLDHSRLAHFDLMSMFGGLLFTLITTCLCRG